ncbi:hypothetical protein [Paraburkholderia strydomiana]|uniref:hypothetical protein n=1 Tax=Paraburkholderia strydomiana TaxID=1245417 RepID=UPI0028591F72|nr:hypothetical protein [Paraburkholderia strydomiana]MDR7006058.1 hypothetical protein [Paraburkholderia strydomiana]
MNNNEFAKLFRLTSPYFPTLGEVFVAVSAGEYRDGTFPQYFGEFFIFSTNGISDSISRRTYVQQHMSAGGASFVFQLAKTRAIAELAEKAVGLVGSSGSAALPSRPSIDEVEWDELVTLYRAGVLAGETLREVADKTRSSFVLTVLDDLLRLSTVTFQDAQFR